MTILGKSISSGMNNFDSTFSLGFINMDGENILAERIIKRKDIQIIEGITAANAQESVSNGKADLVLILPKDFSEKIERGQEAEIKLYHSNNETQIDDLMSSIQRFEENILIQRMDSLGLPDGYINPISVNDVDTSPNFVKKINAGISNYTPILLLFFGFLGFIFPSNITFSEAREKRQIQSNSVLDKIIGISIWAVFSVIFLLIGFWLSFQLTEGHPSFLKGIFRKYLSLSNCIQLIWILTISNLFWASLFAILNRKAKRPIGAFGISYFMFTAIFTCIVLASIFFSSQESAELNPLLFIPPVNAWYMIKNLLIEESTNWMNMLLYISSSLVLGGISFVAASKMLKE